MKYLKIFLKTMIVLSSNMVSGQDLKESEVPQIVRDSFKVKYPNVFVYEWEWKKKKNAYEAEFIMKGSKYEALFLANGVWIFTERDVRKEEVPQAVWSSLSSSEYANWEIDDIEEHSTPTHDVFYEIEVKSYTPQKRKVYLYFLPDGKFIQ